MLLRHFKGLDIVSIPIGKDKILDGIGEERQAGRLRQAGSHERREGGEGSQQAVCLASPSSLLVYPSAL